MPLAFIAALSVAPRTLTLVFGGDVMLNGVPPTTKTFGGIAHILGKADVAMANLEVPLTRATTRTPNKSVDELRRKDQWILKADPAHAPLLRRSGIDLAALGNNHAMDYGPAGLAEMRKLLHRNGIMATGAGTNTQDANRLAVYCHADGTRIGLLSVLAFMTPAALKKNTPASPKAAGVAVLSFGGAINGPARKKLSRWISEARRRCDKLVVAVHWGTERKTVPNPYQVTLGRAIVDAGADVVWGSHPHVLQGAEIYKNRPILYSMGNLISALPGATGLVQVSYAGRGPILDFFPARIRGGRVATLPQREAEAERLRFAELCRQIQTKYPSSDSCAPNLNLYAAKSASTVRR